MARQLTGHLTESTFTRYNITAETDLVDATDRLDQYLEGEASRLPSTDNPRTITPLPTGTGR